MARILAGQLLPSSGTARVLGRDVAENLGFVRRNVGFVAGGDRGFYPRLSGRENIEFFAALRGVRRKRLRELTGAALAEVGLADYAGDRVETYSKGMRQRLHLAVGMIDKPPVLLLDEPTVGLDPAEAQRLRTVIAALRDGGTTILLTSHYLLDIERLADRVLLLRDGRLDLDLTVPELVGKARWVATVVVRGTGDAPTGADFGGLEAVELTRAEDVWTAKLRIPAWREDSLAAVAGVVSRSTVLDVRVEPVTLEDSYLHLLRATTDAVV